VRRSNTAAARPAMPPPAMTTAGAGPGRLTRTPWQNPARRGEPGRRATAAAARPRLPQQTTVVTRLSFWHGNSPDRNAIEAVDPLMRFG
jgi:hypothetical protein